MRPALFGLILVAIVDASAQVQYRPTDPPLVTAVNESWYRLGEPIQFAGELYYPAGPLVFFNGYTMVRIGHYNGVPLYADTTVEPFSIVLVPVTRGLLQPYERLRRADLAGTTGSRVPSFPVQVVPHAPVHPMTAAPPTRPWPPTAAGISAPEALVPAPARPLQETVGTAGIAPRRPVAIGRPPESNDGIWISFQGERWVHAGPAVRLTDADFVQAGVYAGFPVYARRDSPDVIYLPTQEGDRAAPFRLKP